MQRETPSGFTFQNLVVDRESKDVGALVFEAGRRKEEGTGFLRVFDDADEAGYNQKSALKTSVNRATATLYLFGCCFYNCCCCCLPKSCAGPWCGSKFMFGRACICFEIEMRRDRWLWIAHFACFCIHLAFAVASAVVAGENDMGVQIFRVKPSWENVGPNGYVFEVVPANAQFFNIASVTWLFFGFSAAMHGMWVFISPWSCSKSFLWKHLDECRCWWRWFEYSFSASLMFVGIAVVTAIRDQNTLACIFALSWITMMCGMLTELHSRPEVKSTRKDGTIEYNFEKWQGDPDPPAESASRSEKRAYLSARRWNYMYRMTPHFMGIVPYAVAWAVIINNFSEQIDDLCDAIKERMPDFVPFVIYGSALIFSLFTFVQWRYQWTAPVHYWRSELIYCALSATSKVYLGVILFLNVLNAKRFDDAVSFHGGNWSMPNLTAYCLSHNSTELLD